MKTQTRKKLLKTGILLMLIGIAGGNVQTIDGKSAKYDFKTLDDGVMSLHQNTSADIGTPSRGSYYGGAYDDAHAGYFFKGQVYALSSSAYGFQNLIYATTYGAYDEKTGVVIDDTNAKSGGNSAIGTQNFIVNNQNSTVIGFDNRIENISLGNGGNIAYGTNNWVYDSNQTAAIGVGNYVDTADRSFLMGTDNLLENSAFAVVIGYKNEAQKDNAILVGSQNSVTGDSAVAIGAINTASASEAVAIGTNNTASGVRSLAIGGQAKDSDVKNTAYAGGSMAVGLSNQAEAEYSIAIGSKGTVKSQYSQSIGAENYVYGAYAVAYGYKNNIGLKDSSYSWSYYSVAIGSNNTAYNYYTQAIGSENTASANSALAIGRQNTASGYFTQSIGYQNTANSARSLAYGAKNTADGVNSLAIGTNNKTSGEGSIAIGSGVVTEVEGWRFDVRDSQSATGEHAQAIGSQNIVNGSYSIGYGYSNKVYGATTSTAVSNAIAVGASNKVSANIAQAIGSTNTASGIYSAAYGYLNTSSDKSAITFGTANEASGVGAIAIGAGTLNAEGTAVATSQLATGSYAQAIGSKNIVNGDYSVGYGYSNKVYAGESDSQTAVTNAIAVGSSNIVSANNAQAMGSGNRVYSTQSMAYGYINISGNKDDDDVGQGSIAVGNYNVASGTASIAIGIGTSADATNTASGDNSIAIGNTNTAMNTSFAIGTGNKTYVNNALAMGGTNEVQAENSMAFGTDNTIYSSDLSNGKNYDAQAGSMIQGMDNYIYGSDSIAMGSGNIIGKISSKKNEEGKDVIDTGKSVASDVTLAFGVKNTAQIGSTKLGELAEYALDNKVLTDGDVQTLAAAIASKSADPASAMAQIQGKSAKDLVTLAKGLEEGDQKELVTWSGHGLLIGESNTVYGAKSLGFGVENTVNSVGSVVLGGDNTVGKSTTNDNERDFLSMAIGSYNTIEGSLNVTMGIGSLTYGTQTISIGQNTVGQSKNTVETGIGLGIGNEIYSDSSVAIGGKNIVDAKAAIPTATDKDGQPLKGYALAFGVNNKNYASASMALGGSNTLGKETTERINSIVMGISNTVDASNAMGLGVGNTAEVKDVTLADYAPLSQIINSYDWSTMSQGTLLGMTAAEIAAQGDAKTLSGGAMMIGQSNTVDAPLGLGFGTENKVSAIGSIALGGNNTVGNTAATDANRDYLSMAIGSGNSIKGSLNVSMGIGNDTVASQTISIGRNTIGKGGLTAAGTTDGGATIYKTSGTTEALNTGIGVGMNNTIESDYSVAIGGNNYVKGIANVQDAAGHDVGSGYALAFGIDNKNYASSSMAMGGSNTLGSTDTQLAESVVLGMNNNVQTSNAMAIGGKIKIGTEAAPSNEETTENAIMLTADDGSTTAVSGNEVAMGTGITIYKDAGQSTALGGANTIASSNSVALGYKSVVAEQQENVVSVGYQNNDDVLLRRVVNVADAQDLQDAATFAQIAELDQTLKFNAKQTKQTLVTNGGDTVATITLEAGEIKSGSNGYVSGDEIYNYIKNVAGGGIVDYDKQYPANGDHWLSTDFDLTVSEKGTDSAAYGYGANAKGNESTAVGTYATADGAGSVALGSDSVATGGNVSFGHTKDDTDPATGKKYGTDLTRKLTNVADGTANTDAATVGQSVAHNQTLVFTKDDNTKTLVDGNGDTVATITVNDLGTTIAADQHISFTDTKDGSPTQSNVIKDADGNALVTFEKGKVELNNKNLVDGGTVYDAIAAKNQKINKSNNQIMANDGTTVLATIETYDATKGSDVDQGDTYVTYGDVKEITTNIVNENTIVDFDKTYKDSGKESGKHWLSTDFDNENVTHGDDSTAYGYGANAKGDESTALGKNAVANAQGSVAIGSDSVATETGEVSFGHSKTDTNPATGKPYTEDLKRKLTHVADGTENSDVATYGQTVKSGTVDLSKDGESNVIKNRNGDVLVTFTKGTVADNDTGFVSGDDVYSAIAAKNQEISGTNNVIRDNSGNKIATILTADSDNPVKDGDKYITENYFYKNIYNAVDEYSIVDFDKDYEKSGQHWLSTDFDKTFEKKGEESTAYGYGANAQADNSVAIGAGSVATEANSFSVGSVGSERQIVNVAYGDSNQDAAAYGQILAKQADGQSYNVSTTNNTVKLKANDGTTLATIDVQFPEYDPTEVADPFVQRSDGDHWIDVKWNEGDGETVTRGENSVAFGYQANASADNSVAIGYGSKATEENTFSVGSTDSQRRITNVAAGNEVKNGTDAANVGQIAAHNQSVSAKNNTIKDNNGNVIATIYGLDGSAGGGIVDFDEDYGTSGNHYLSTDFGNEDNVEHGKDSTAYGYGANAKGDNSTAIGKDAKANAAGSVAIGEGSVANDPNEVSFGNDTTKRKLTNVAEGTNPSDVATYGQTVAAGTVNLSNTKAGDKNQTNVIRNVNGDVLVTIEKGEVAEGNTGFTSGGDVWNAIAAKDQTITADNQTIMANDGKTKLATIGTADDASDKTTPSNYYTTKNYVDNIIKNISGGSSIVDYDENYEKSGDHYLSTDFGNEDNVEHGKDSTAYGYGANAKGDNSVALGKDAVAEGKGSVAIGEGSVATKANEVSFGNETTKRKLTNVAEGTVNSDVATYGQTVQKGTVNFSNTTAGDAAQSNVIKNNKGEVLVTIEKGKIESGNTGLTSGGDVYDAIAAKGQTVSFDNTTDGATGQTNVIKNNKGEVLATIQKGSITDGNHGLVDGDTVYDYVKDHTGTTLAEDQHISFTDTKDGSKTQSNVIKDADGKTIVTFDKGAVEKGNTNLVDGGTVWNEIASKDQVVSFANTKDGDEGQTNVIKNNKGEVLATIKKGTITDGDDGIVSGDDVYDYVKDHTGTTLAEDQHISFTDTKDGSKTQSNVIKDVDGKTIVTFDKGAVEKDNTNLVDGGTVWNSIAAEDQKISGANNTIKANDGTVLATIATAKDPTDQTTSKDSYTTKEYVDTIITSHTGTTLAEDQHISFTDTKDGSPTQSNVIKDADGKTIVTFDKGKVEKDNKNLVDGGTVYDEIAQHNQTLTLNKDNQYSATLKDGANKDIATITLDTTGLGGTQLPADQKVSFDNTDGKDGQDKTNVIKDNEGNTIVEFEKGKVEEGNTGFATGGDVWNNSIKPTEINKDQRKIENNAGDTLVTFTEGEVAKDNKGFVAGGDVYNAIAAKDQTIDKTNNKIVSNDGTTLATIKTYDSSKTDKENKDSFVTYDDVKDTIDHTIAPDQVVSFDNTTDGAKDQTNVIRGDNGDVLVTIQKGEVAKGDTGLVSGGDVYNASVAKNQIIYATTDAREDDSSKQQNVIYDNSGNKLATMAVGTVTSGSTGFVSGGDVYDKLVQNYTYTVEYEKVSDDPNDKAAVGTVKVLDNKGDTAFTITGIQTEIGSDLKPYVPYTGDGKTIDIDENKVISAKTTDTLTEGGEKLVTAGTMYKEDREAIAKAGETNIISNQSVGDNLVALDKVIGKMDEGSPDNTDPDKKTYNTINSGDSISENLEAIDTALAETEGLIKLSDDKKQILVGSGDNAAYATSVSFADNRGQARRLTDVADGTALTDAANVGQIAAHDQTLTFTKDVNTQKLVDGNGDTIATIKIDGVGGGTTLPAGQKVSFDNTEGTDGTDAGKTNVIRDDKGNTLVEFEKGKIDKGNTGFVSGGDIYDAIAAKGQTIDGTNNTIKSNDGTVLATIKTYDPTKSDEENKDAFVTNQYIDQSVTNIVNKNSIVSYDKDYATSDDHWVSTDFGADDVTHGKDSTAYGYGSNAKGEAATAIGRGNIAEADHTTAIGYKNEATGGHSTAVGDENKTSGDKSAAYGYHNEASGDNSTAIGQYSKSEGENSIAIGNGADAKGTDAIAIGRGTSAAEGSAAFGPESVAKDKNEVSFGHSSGDTAPDGTTYDSDLNRKLTHVADGTDDHDAATVGQVNKVGDRVTEVEKKVDGYDSRISGVEDSMGKGIAGASALAALHPLEFDPDDKASFAVGYGHFKSSDALALGAFYRPNESVLFSFGGVLGNGEDQFNAGISFALGRDDERTHPLGRIEMSRRIQTLQEENAGLTDRVDRLERFIAQMMANGNQQEAQPIPTV